MKRRWFARQIAVLWAMILLGVGGGMTMTEEARASEGTSAWTPRDNVRAFYSGHSLSDGVAEVVEHIARSLRHRFSFEGQSMGYSLLRQRTKGEAPAAAEWPGYRAGHNRRGAGMDVAEELRQPQRLGAGGKYDVLVVTERHDLPNIARKERTAFYLADMAKHLIAGNPDAEVLLYHTWLHVDLDAPQPWIDYERAVLPMWECVAARANLDLPPRGEAPRVRVLPGGSALAELAAALWDGKVQGVSATDPAARVRLLFSDNVHMSEIGRYYIALLHYAILFGRSPEGAARPAALSLEASRYMQTLAWQFASSYGQRANAAVRRDMAACRDVIQKDVCPAYVTYKEGKGMPVIGSLKRQYETRACQRGYGDPNDPENPFSQPAK